MAGTIMNTARRRTRPEEILHRQVAAFLDVALPMGAVWFHPPNGGARSKAEAGIFKALGVKPGVPDIVIIWKGRFFGIELKAPKNKLTPYQAAFHQALVLAGAVVTFCTSLDEVIAFLEMIGMPLKARAAA